MDDSRIRPKVIISGAGLAGLITAIMFEFAGIDYHILEQASRLRPLGTSISLHPVVMRLMDQLGLLDDIHRIGKPLKSISILSSTGRKMSKIDVRGNKRRHGSQAMVMSRPELHQLLLSRIPSHKITTGKRVVDYVEDETGVTVVCMDETTYRGDFVIGADGAYSTIRQIMYQKLHTQGKLSQSDCLPLQYDKHCVVGITDELDPVKYPVLLDKSCEMKVVLGKDQRTSMWLMPLVGNRIGWCVGGPDPRQEQEREADHHHNNHHHSHVHDDDESDRMSHASFASRSKFDHIFHPLRRAASSDHLRAGSEDSSRSSIHWGPESPSEILAEAHQFKCPYSSGSALDLIQATPLDRVSKVLLEEKMFESWYSGRVVLIGDGASQAILDAAYLVNLFVDLRSTSLKELTMAFEDYYQARSNTAKLALDSSRDMANVIYEKSLRASVARNIALRVAPTWFLQLMTDSINTDTPLLKFLPYVANKGSRKKQKYRFMQSLQ
ncbi:hypothetical protein DFQ27_005083 [Actinomortierella ambigua]|uniref:FAD-binding domain-containing protein n=1 Tax=Actinomortierella ambigua TaxID=1343610 RepID=A0A9P6U2B3_9FUNG|nr:hypothetical protein DFQ27_005083 [Actinomortierella ambigua]